MGLLQCQAAVQPAGYLRLHLCQQVPLIRVRCNIAFPVALELHTSPEHMPGMSAGNHNHHNVMFCVI